MAISSSCLICRVSVLWDKVTRVYLVCSCFPRFRWQSLWNCQDTGRWDVNPSAPWSSFLSLPYHVPLLQPRGGRQAQPCMIRSTGGLRTEPLCPWAWRSWWQQSFGLRWSPCLSQADNFRHQLWIQYNWTSEIHFILVLCRYFRVALLPSSTDVSCLFRTKVHPAAESLLFSDVFRVAISQTALQQKTLRVDLCSVSKHQREECLVGLFIISIIR